MKKRTTAVSIQMHKVEGYQCVPYTYNPLIGKGVADFWKMITLKKTNTSYLFDAVCHL